MTKFYRVVIGEKHFVFTKEAYSKLLITDQQVFESTAENVHPSEKIYDVDDLNELEEVFDIEEELTQQSDDGIFEAWEDDV